MLTVKSNIHALKSMRKLWLSIISLTSTFSKPLRCSFNFKTNEKPQWKGVCFSVQEQWQMYSIGNKWLTVSLLGSKSFRILKKFFPYCLKPFMNRFCWEKKREKQLKLDFYSPITTDMKLYTYITLWNATGRKQCCDLNLKISACASTAQLQWGKKKRGNDNKSRNRIRD